MRQWVKLGQFRTFISRRVLNGLACEFRPEWGKFGPSEQDLYTTRSEARLAQRFLFTSATPEQAQCRPRSSVCGLSQGAAQEPRTPRRGPRYLRLTFSGWANWRLDTSLPLACSSLYGSAFCAGSDPVMSLKGSFLTHSNRAKKLYAAPNCQILTP